MTPLRHKLQQGGMTLYSISWNDKSVGRAEVQSEGLYYRFICACELPDDRIYRITVSDSQTVKDLGICVPDGKKFGLNTRIPKKYLKGETLIFSLTSSNKKNNVLPVADGAPFPQLEDLENARLQFTDGQAQILIDPVQDPQDNGLNP